MKKIIIIIFLFSLNLNAQTIITDRPDQSESPSVIEPGSLQIETGFLISQIEEIESLRNLNRKKNIYLPSTLFRIGLSNNIELRVFNQYQFQVFGSNLAHGFNDLEVGLKIQLLNKENSFTQIAFLSHALLPSAPSLFSDETFGSINKICVSHDLNGKIGIGYNLDITTIMMKPITTHILLLLDLKLTKKLVDILNLMDLLKILMIQKIT